MSCSNAEDEYVFVCVLVMGSVWMAWMNYASGSERALASTGKHFVRFVQMLSVHKPRHFRMKNVGEAIKMSCWSQNQDFLRASYFDGVCLVLVVDHNRLTSFWNFLQVKRLLSVETEEMYKSRLEAEAKSKAVRPPHVIRHSPPSKWSEDGRFS